MSVQVDDELHIQFMHALRNAATELGVATVSPSVMMRHLITQYIGERKPFDAGWLEGYNAGFGAVMRVFQETLRKVNEDPGSVVGIGVISPHERDDG